MISGSRASSELIAWVGANPNVSSIAMMLAMVAFTDSSCIGDLLSDRIIGHSVVKLGVKKHGVR